MKALAPDASVARFADRLSALGNEARLRILRLLLAAHPQGMVVGDIQAELEIPSSTLSHHLDKLKSEELVAVRRDRQFLWYTANTETVRELVAFLFAECCSRSRAIPPDSITQVCVKVAREGGPQAPG